MSIVTVILKKYFKNIEKIEKVTYKMFDSLQII